MRASIRHKVPHHHMVNIPPDTLRSMVERELSHGMADPIRQHWMLVVTEDDQDKSRQYEAVVDIFTPGEFELAVKRELYHLLLDIARDSDPLQTVKTTLQALRKEMR